MTGLMYFVGLVILACGPLYAGNVPAALTVLGAGILIFAVVYFILNIGDL